MGGRLNRHPAKASASTPTSHNFYNANGPTSELFDWPLQRHLMEKKKNSSYASFDIRTGFLFSERDWEVFLIPPISRSLIVTDKIRVPFPCSTDSDFSEVSSLICGFVIPLNFFNTDTPRGTHKIRCQCSIETT